VASSIEDYRDRHAGPLVRRNTARRRDRVRRQSWFGRGTSHAAPSAIRVSRCHSSSPSEGFTGKMPVARPERADTRGLSKSAPGRSTDSWTVVARPDSARRLEIAEECQKPCLNRKTLLDLMLALRKHNLLVCKHGFFEKAGQPYPVIVQAGGD
jgi:hypothetical protein